MTWQPGAYSSRDTLAVAFGNKAADLKRDIFEGVAIRQQHFLRAGGVEFLTRDFNDLSQAAAGEKEPPVLPAQVASE